MKKQLLHSLIFMAVVLCTTLLSRPVNAEPILGAIVTADLPRYQQAHQAMVKVLQAAGFGEGKLKIFAQTPNADKMSLLNSLRRFEAAGATVVVTYGCRAAEVAKSELKDTPLLFADVYDPVSLGIVKTLAAPGTDASGATSKTSIKQLVEALIAIKPVKKVGVLYTKGEGGSAQQLAELQEQGKGFGFSVSAENARNPKEAAELGSKLAAESDALYLSESIAVALQSNHRLLRRGVVLRDIVRRGEPVLRIRRQFVARVLLQEGLERAGRLGVAFLSEAGPSPSFQKPCQKHPVGCTPRVSPKAIPTLSEKN